jgi:hypothetical protein
VPKPRLTKPVRARRYLQASMESGYTGLPAEHKRAKQGLMREHERAYPKVREHALAGAQRDFDLPLTSGEREHQRHLRQQEGLTEHDVRNIRDELRAIPTRSETRGRETTSSPAVPTKAVGGAIGAAATGKGSLFLQIAGMFVLLSLVYLLVSEKGKTNGIKALQGLTGVLTGAVRTFIAPEDPIAKLENALSAGPISTSPTSGSGSGGSSGSGSSESSNVSPVPPNSLGLTGSVGGKGTNTWKLHLAPKPSKIKIPKVKIASPAEVAAFNRATGAHLGG